MAEYDRLTNIIPEDEYAEDLIQIRDALLQDSSGIVLPERIKGDNLKEKINQPPPPIVLTKAILGRRWLEMTAYAACFALVMFGLYKMAHYTFNDVMVIQDAETSKQVIGAAADSSAMGVQGEISAARNIQGEETSRILSDAVGNPLFASGASPMEIAVPKQPVASDYSTVANAFTGAQEPLPAAQESGQLPQEKGTSDAFMSVQEGPQESFAARANDSFSAVQIENQTVGPAIFENLLSDGEYLFHYRKDFENKGAEISIVRAADLIRVSGIKLDEHTDVRMHLLNNKLAIIQNVPQNEAAKTVNGIVEKTSELTGRKKDEVDLFISQDEKSLPPAMQMTEVFVYDVSDKENPKIDKHVTLDGGYRYSDIQNEILCLVTVKNIDISMGKFDNARDLFPIVASDGKFRILKPEEIILPPEFISGNSGYTVTSVLDLITGDVSFKAIMGKTNHVMRNLGNLYFVSTMQQNSPDSSGYRSEIIKLKIEQRKVFFVSQKNVAGMVEGADSLMEYNGTLQVAATDYTHNGDASVQIVLLDEMLQSVGAVSETLQGERIESARLLGRYGYVVAKNDDKSVFAIDFENPREFVMRGPLAISELPRVLIPIDTKKVLGVTTNDREDSFGGTYQDGLKIVLYDVGDPLEIKELNQVLLGNIGSHSEAVDSERAVLFDHDNQIIGIPATLYTSRGATDRDPWGGDRRLTFDGILVFFVENDSLTIECEFLNDSAGEGYYRSDIDSTIESAVISENRLFISFASRLAAFDVKTCSLMQELNYPKQR